MRETTTTTPETTLKPVAAGSEVLSVCSYQNEQSPGTFIAACPELGLITSSLSEEEAMKTLREKIGERIGELRDERDSRLGDVHADPAHPNKDALQDSLEKGRALVRQVRTETWSVVTVTAQGEIAAERRVDAAKVYNWLCMLMFFSVTRGNEYLAEGAEAEAREMFTTAGWISLVTGLLCTRREKP